LNYYERHIGDYLKDTAHLSLLEHGVYARLLDVYYTREGGIPEKEAARLIGARSKDERAALLTVLGDYFTLTDGNWIQGRAEREIERYHGKQAKAKASADARWSAQRQQSERNANASPNEDAQSMRTHSEGNAPSLQTPDPEEKEITPRSTLVLVGTATAAPPYRKPSCPTEDLIRIFHERLPQLPAVEVLTDGRKRHISARWAQVCAESKFDRAQGLDWFGWFFEHVGKSPFLMGQVKGRNGDYFRCTLDFLMTPEKFARVIEGFYHKASA
jgi:uncharacterized protein YdaU (DUF1376 family)